MSKKEILDDSMYKGFKLRIYPTEKQIEKINQYFGMVRFVYNKGKELCDSYYDENKDNPSVKYKRLNFKDLQSYITDLKRQPGYKWLDDMNADSWKTVLKDLINGYTSYFNKITKGLPKYKTKRNANQSFPTRKDRMSILGNQLRLSSFKDDPIYISNIPKELQGFSNKNIKTGTGKGNKIYDGYSYLEYCNPRISYDGIHYYISFTLKRCDEKNIIKEYDYASTKKFKHNKEWNNKPSSDIIGLDWGCRYDNWFVSSDGNRLPRPNQTKIDKQIAGYQKKLARQQRINKKKHIVRTKQYYTKNEQKTLKRMNKAYKKHTNQRINIMHNFINKVIETKPEAVVFETLHVKKAMQKGNPKYAKLVKDSIYYESTEMFKYKCEANGIKVIFAPDGFKSTKTCSRCSNIYNKVGNKRIYKCPHCGLVIDRDLNAAINLKNYGYSVLHKFDNVDCSDIA